MQHNYYFLKRLLPALEARLVGSTFIEAFSQEKDELILCFLRANQAPFYIRATLKSDFTCLSFPDDFRRSRKNSINLFEALAEQQVLATRMYLNERAFSLQLESHELLFKMHGNRSNLVLFKNGEVAELFKNKLKADLHLDLSQLDRPISRSLELFKQEPELKAFYPTFGKVPSLYLAQHGYTEKSVEEKWQLLQEVEVLMESNPCYLVPLNGKPTLSLLALQDHELVGHDLLEASNRLFRAVTSEYYFAREKQSLLSRINKQLTQTENYIRKSEARLEQLTHETQPDQIADIIMANLHQIEARKKKVRLFNFYTNEDIDIKLNAELSPQKNAENYYRKSKNRKIEVEKTEANIFDKYEKQEQLKSLSDQIEAITSFKALRQFIKTHGLEQSNSPGNKEVKPYKSFEVQGFQVWVGKNAKANDELTLKYAYKEDLWLHAKDVPGSHVLLKHQSGKAVPKLVIERAAELAAWYSKRKTDSLVPVIVTPAKFVRKRKGSPPGQVIVSKEEVIMVPPVGPKD